MVLFSWVASSTVFCNFIKIAGHLQLMFWEEIDKFCSKLSWFAQILVTKRIKDPLPLEPWRHHVMTSSDRLFSSIIVGSLTDFFYKYLYNMSATGLAETDCY